MKYGDKLFGVLPATATGAKEFEGRASAGPRFSAHPQARGALWAEAEKR